MKRRPNLELLDTDSGTAAEIAASIRDLQMFNQWFGGVRTSEALLRRALSNLRRRNCSLLEVAAGDGYVPGTVRRRLAPGLDLQITLLDRSPKHLNGNSTTPAGQNPARWGPRNSRAVAADALNLPFSDNSFDLVSCNLFLHHLAPEEVQTFAREALRVCRVAFLINDLVRDPLHLALAYAGFPLYRSRLTRNDAPASVRQAYTPAELRPLLAASGAREVSMSRHYLYRVGIVAWK